MTKTALTAAFDQMAHTVDKAFPSLFTKEDVIVVLKDLEEQLKAEMGDSDSTETVTGFSQEQIREIADNAASSIVSEGMDLVEDYDLCMNYREVEIDTISLDESRIAKEIERAITDWFESNAIEIN